MAEDAKRQRGSDAHGDATRKPPPDGATYRTSKHSKTGVGHEQPAKDVREERARD